MMNSDHVQTLRERRDWLKARIAGKKSIGWETQWDEREHAALTWAVKVLERVLMEYYGNETIAS